MESRHPTDCEERGLVSTPTDVISLASSMPKPILHYEVHGKDGPLLLLVHGLLSSRAQWLPNCPQLFALTYYSP